MRASLELSHQFTVPVLLNELVKSGPLQLPARGSTARAVNTCMCLQRRIGLLFLDSLHFPDPLECLQAFLLHLLGRGHIL